MAQRGLWLPAEIKERLEATRRARGYRSANALIVDAIREKLERLDGEETRSHAEERLAANVSRLSAEMRSVHTSVQAQFALMEAFVKSFFTCMPEPPREQLPAAQANARFRFENLRRMAAASMSGDRSLLEGNHDDGE